MTKAQLAKLAPGTVVWCVASDNEEAPWPFCEVFLRTVSERDGSVYATMDRDDIYWRPPEVFRTELAAWKYYRRLCATWERVHVKAQDDIVCRAARADLKIMGLEAGKEKS